MTFTEDDRIYTGEVIHVSGPQLTITGKQLPTTYEVDAGDGFPHNVVSSQINERSSNSIAKLAQPSPRRHKMTFCDKCHKATGRAAIEQFDRVTQRYILLPLYCNDCSK